MRLEVPLATVGPGRWTEACPFTGAAEAEASTEEPAPEEGLAPVTTSGVDAGFFVAPAAEAYEGADEAAVVF